MRKWSVPCLWPDETVFILGGGPSLPLDRLPELRGRGKVIAVNNAGFRAPWADILFFADHRWMTWNRDRLDEFEGEYIVTRQPVFVNDDPILYLDYKPYRLSHVPTALGGLCGGSSAINLAYLLGAARIVLLGFDYRPGNFHSEHKTDGPDEDHYRLKFMPAMKHIATGLESTSVSVWNTTPNSALEFFPLKSIDEFLA